MIIKKDNSRIKYLYHYTSIENVSKIIESGKITSKDNYMFFTDSYYKSINLFEDEMMSNNYYIDLDCKLKRRSYANPKDYRIIKIPYYNDGKFVKFIFDNMSKNSIYNVSKIHEGELFFDSSKVEVLEVNIQKGFKITLPLFTKLAFLFTIFMSPVKSKADTWLDNPEYYDISWFDEDQYDSTTNYSLFSPEEIAGLSYIANNMNYTFEGKTIQLVSSDCNRSGCYTYMINHDWVPLPSTFAGNFDCRTYNSRLRLCGLHRIIFANDPEEIPFVENNGLCNMYKYQTADEIETNECSQMFENRPALYVHTVSDHGTIFVTYNRAIANIMNTFSITPDYGYSLISYSVLNDNTGESLCGQNKLYFDMPEDSDVTITANYERNCGGLSIQYDEELCSLNLTGNIPICYGDTLDFVVTPIDDYELVGYTLNDETYLVMSGNSFSVSNIFDGTIEIIVDKTKYTITTTNNDYSFNIDKEFSSINSVELCKDENDCITLTESDFTIDNQNIKLNAPFISTQEKREYELVITFANGEKGHISFRIGEGPTINPSTRKNIFFVFLIILGILGLAFNYKKRVEKHE